MIEQNLIVEEIQLKTHKEVVIVNIYSVRQKMQMQPFLQVSINNL